MALAGLRGMTSPNLYLPNHYLDMGAIISSPYPFLVCVSSRGGGKTYGTLSYCAEHGIRFLYLRRTQRILDLITEPHLHPFKRINTDRGWNIYPERAKGFATFVEGAGEDKRIIGYASALSTFANVRGFDGSDIDLIIFDEFIPEDNEIVRFNMFTALSNAIETVGRNRELEGREPVKVLLLSNSDLIYGDIIAGFDIGDDLISMQETGTEIVEKSADMLLIMPMCEGFKVLKADTALYRVTAGSQFSEVALDNKFRVHDRKRVKSRPLSEYKPVATIYGICIYRHKNNRTYYITDKVSGTPQAYESNETDRRRFLRDHPEIWLAYQSRRIIFESIRVQTIYKRLFE